MGIDFTFVSGVAGVAADLCRRTGWPDWWPTTVVVESGVIFHGEDPNADYEITAAGASCFVPLWRIQYAARSARVAALIARAHAHLDALRRLLGEVEEGRP